MYIEPDDYDESWDDQIPEMGFDDLADEAYEDYIQQYLDSPEGLDPEVEEYFKSLGDGD